MPRGYGQLGCSGFIISDKDGCFVSRQTSAYLDYGEGAFRQVERILKDLVPKSASAKRLKREESKTEEDSQASKKGKEENLTRRVELPPSVGVNSMDDEHKECTDSFNKAFESPSVGNLRDLYNILKSHFDHEEKLMLEFSDDDSDGEFSALYSHKMDHERMLKIAQNELDRLKCTGSK
eukprot:CAMPEP_0113309600 /NCGR_PEP_ID=MMETSP0010_2-20120614/7577_1 /TAXON_ID=216773 ORGANISM="Corethron hystrix, Strain 308" /NCGR_SAMPLE_ID=MMETSP0010_2 /ASSEMBLY_ACC=CAM_ASM_000155 /LENGTH=178 /DNA_ID=CAMNT_0000164881 /DNA_START=407 /DNA_END=943 /DNA_ORIENTATION=+ /assembly_acc=CAM_ASM_000155